MMASGVLGLGDGGLGLGSGRVRRVRRICIGVVTYPHYILTGNAGFPWCYLIYWRGRSEPYQPREFRNLAALESAVRHRLRMAGLELLTMGEIAEHSWMARLYVTVGRQANSADGGMASSGWGMPRPQTQNPKPHPPT